MAKEILVLGSGDVYFFLRFDVAPVQIDGAPQELSNSDQLPEGSEPFISDADLLMIDSGRCLYERVNVRVNPDLPSNEFADRVRAKYAKWAEQKNEEIARTNLGNSDAGWIPLDPGGE